MSVGSQLQDFFALQSAEVKNKLCQQFTPPRVIHVVLFFFCVMSMMVKLYNGRENAKKLGKKRQSAERTKKNHVQSDAITQTVVSTVESGKLRRLSVDFGLCFDFGVELLELFLDFFRLPSGFWFPGSAKQMSPKRDFMSNMALRGGEDFNSPRWLPKPSVKN